ncbi:MAG: hypothetical protein CSA97_01645 [Bacteroidetes bacterium]|nr:MAG: hypothetical protein CSA97_01645 [Bacteroidota bacterium]
MAPICNLAYGGYLYMKKLLYYPSLLILTLLHLLATQACIAQRPATPHTNPKAQNTQKEQASPRTPPPAITLQKMPPPPLPAELNTTAYLPLLQGKIIALVANHTSSAEGIHLIDRLLAHNIYIKAIFTPEHGLKGLADAGQNIGNSMLKNGIKIYSLYGKQKRPTEEQLRNIDLIIYDLQDVGVRCYTYLSTLQYIMEACAQQNIHLIILDRPNPNGHYVDGPTLEPRYRSFVGMQPIPWVHGMTTGEYALMLNGEKWLKDGAQCPLTVIKCPYYAHTSEYPIEIPPSPNLPTQNAVYLYPSLALFEGTTVSVGRGTTSPFELIGSPTHPQTTFSFTPRPTTGAKHPPYEGRRCHGLDLRHLRDSARPARLNLTYLIQMYQSCPSKSKFFTRFFNQLAGTPDLRKAMEDGWTEEQIRQQWAKDLEQFKSIRRKYLLYPDTIKLQGQP